MGSFLGNRWDIDFTDKRIFRDLAETPTVTDTTLALYSALQDLMDEPLNMDNPIPMSAQTPTEFTLINGWFVDDESIEFLTGGALQSISWEIAATEIRAISYDATAAGTMFETNDRGETITGTTTTDTGTLLFWDERYGTELGVVWIRPDVGGAAGDAFDNATEAYTVSGSAAAGIFSVTYDAGGAREGNSLWPNIFSLGTLADDTQLYIIRERANVVSRDVPVSSTKWWSVGQIDLLVKVKEGDTEIDDAVVIVFARQYSKGYDNFEVDLTTGGRQPIPFSTGDDINNNTGLRQMTAAGTSAGNWNVGDVIEDDSDPLIQGVITAVSASNPNIVLGYYPVGPDLADFTGATGTLSNNDDTGTMTAVAPVNIGPNAITPVPTLVVAGVDTSLGGGQATAPYSLTLDANANTVADVYEWLKSITKRGEGTGGVVETAFTAQAGTDPTITGEQYTGYQAQIEYSSQAGGEWVEGDEVFDQTSGASGTVVGDHPVAAAGDVLLRNVRGTFQTGAANLGDAPSGPTVTATIDSIRLITTPKVAPFGTFAGGIFFGAPGVVISDVDAGDVQNFQLVDDDGNVQNPPNFVNATVTGLNGTDDDRAAIYVLTAPAGIIDKAQHDITAPAGAFNGLADGDVRVDVNFPNDTPESGVVKVVDNINNKELRMRYSAFGTPTGADLTLSAVTEGTGATSTSATQLIDTSANFTDDPANDPQIGDHVRNTFGGKTTELWIITGIVSATVLDVIPHPASIGTPSDFDSGDTYEINRVPYDLDAGDTAYVPILDVIAGAGDPVSESSANLVYLADIPVLVVVRNGGSVDPIQPFEVENTITTAGLTQAAIRTPDTIAT